MSGDFPIFFLVSLSESEALLFLLVKRPQSRVKVRKQMHDGNECEKGSYGVVIRGSVMLSSLGRFPKYWVRNDPIRNLGFERGGFNHQVYSS